MPKEIVMPKLGESVVEGVIGRWLKKEGDRIEEDEPPTLRLIREK